MRDLDIQLLKSFVAIAETRNVTAAARILNRSQPAVSLQLKRLEEIAGKALFNPDRRQLQLTREGEILLGYAYRILQLNNEARSQLSVPCAQGTVVLGIPDLYAASLLPEVLWDFSRQFPKVEIELRCALSKYLAESLQQGHLDVALLSQLQSDTSAKFVRHEQLVWTSHPHLHIPKDAPVPLALLPPGHLYRSVALDALDRIGREWWIACVSESITGLQAAVYAGRAVCILAESAVSPAMRRLGRAEGFPKLPGAPLVLCHKPGPPSEAALCLSDFLLDHLSKSD